MLEQMGIHRKLHHESGPGQNEIDFRYSDPLTAADNAVTFHAVVRTVAAQRPLRRLLPQAPSNRDGNSMHINLSARDRNAGSLHHVIAGILARAADMTVFLNPCEASYDRLGSAKAPSHITGPGENRSQLIRIPAAVGDSAGRSFAPRSDG